VIAAGTACLADVARAEKTTDYTALCQAIEARFALSIEPHDHALPHVLGAIAKGSHRDHGVVITALVLYRGGSEAGAGFYEICQELGALRAGSLSAMDKTIFQAEHSRAVFDAYRASD
jgi:hypothetical protein